jgi:hypothetical protein
MEITAFLSRVTCNSKNPIGFATLEFPTVQQPTDPRKKQPGTVIIPFL